MTTTVFDTLSYAKRLKAAGFSEAQAEAQAEALAEAVGGTLVTRHDLSDATQQLSAAIASCKGELTEGMQGLKRAVELGLRDGNESTLKLEARVNLIQWMLGFVLALVVTILFKIFA
jgi:hypothetical protein